MVNRALVDLRVQGEDSAEVEVAHLLSEAEAVVLAEAASAACSDDRSQFAPRISLGHLGGMSEEYVLESIHDRTQRNNTLFFVVFTM